MEKISDISALTDKTIDEDDEKYKNNESVKQSSNAIWSLFKYFIKVVLKHFDIFLDYLKQFLFP